MSDNVVVEEGHNHPDFGPVTTHTRVSNGQIAEARIDNINIPLACDIALTNHFIKAQGVFQEEATLPRSCPESITTFFNHFRDSGYSVTPSRDGLIAIQPENPTTDQTAYTLSNFLKSGM